ncbi:hypothetical protein [Aquisediminimonas sediminicola]|uniref:hypothetical protein n=1 Tax=Alteraquisediminimonas sediminicola TaxID=2676787 RepID=UPI001C8DE11B|nr:hypothetical protein [Aquisediminimonas sediminicola]
MDRRRNDLVRIDLATYRPSMADNDHSTSGSLLTIFDIVDKAVLDQHCRSVVIHQSDLANLILACMTEAIPIRHFRFHKHHHPEHLALTDSDFEAFTDNGVGPFSKKAQKLANKVDQTFEQRRLLNGHLFTSVKNLDEWHLFYFDQRDTDPHDNHWKHGEHIHLMNWVTHPRLSAPDIVHKIEAEDRPKLNGKLHIRYHR